MKHGFCMATLGLGPSVGSKNLVCNDRREENSGEGQRVRDSVDVFLQSVALLCYSRPPLVVQPIKVILAAASTTLGL